MEVKNFLNEMEKADFFKYNKFCSETKSRDFDEIDKEFLIDLYYMLKSKDKDLSAFAEVVCDSFVDYKDVKTDHFATDDDYWCPFVVTKMLSKDVKTDVIKLGKKIRKEFEKKNREDNLLNH